MKITGIVAVGKNLEIGRDGKLPWHYPADLSFFKRTTTGHVIVMGFNTWLSIGKPLPNRKNVVLSRSRSVDDEGVLCLKEVEDVIHRFSETESEIFVIGGAQVYKSFGSRIDEWLVTRIPEEIEDADAFMEKDFLEGYEKISEERLDESLIVQRLVRK